MAQVRRTLPALPLFALVGLMIVLPLLLTAALAFTEFSGLAAPRWDGLGRFRAVFNDDVFWRALRNSAWFLAVTLPLRALLAWLSALLLRAPAPALAPTLIPDTAYALVALWVFNPLYGPLNVMLSALGWAGPGWLGEVSAAPWVFVLMAALQMGEAHLIARAALRAIAPELIEAARLDGAGAFALTRHVRWPLVRDGLALALARDAVLLSAWTLVPTLLLTGGDPYYSTLFLPLHALRTSVDFMRFGEGAVITLVQWLLLLPVLMPAARQLAVRDA
jgi:multiple sugar transport system permease protein